jgi:hypothetical protein
MPWKDRQKQNADTLARYHKNREDILPRRRARALERLAEKAGRTPGPACDICLRPFTATPHYDHNHATGEFRGWLCGPCNKALGLFQDLPDNLLAAASYLRKKGFAAG